jgi:hypothetical protein
MGAAHVYVYGSGSNFKAFHKSMQHDTESVLHCARESHPTKGLFIAIFLNIFVGDQKEQGGIHIYYSATLACIHHEVCAAFDKVPVTNRDPEKSF